MVHSSSYGLDVAYGMILTLACDKSELQNDVIFFRNTVLFYFINQNVDYSIFHFGFMPIPIRGKEIHHRRLDLELGNQSQRQLPSRPPRNHE